MGYDIAHWARISYDIPGAEGIGKYIIQGDTGMYNNNIDSDERRQQLVRRLSRGGMFRVEFVHFPDQPEIAEYIARCNEGPHIRYVNLDARPGAKVSILM